MQEAMLLGQRLGPLQPDIDLARSDVGQLRTERAHGALAREALAHPLGVGRITGLEHGECRAG